MFGEKKDKENGDREFNVSRDKVLKIYFKRRF
jgi:hypothetical protein